VGGERAGIPVADFDILKIRVRVFCQNYTVRRITLRF